MSLSGRPLFIKDKFLTFDKMVCEKCEKKLGRIITPDPWKAGARNTTESGGRKLNENKAVGGSKARFSPYTTKFEACRICKQNVCIITKRKKIKSF